MKNTGGGRRVVCSLRKYEKNQYINFRSLIKIIYVFCSVLGFIIKEKFKENVYFYLVSYKYLDYKGQ